MTPTNDGKPRTTGAKAVVLVVDDVEEQRYALRRTLQQAGLEVIEAATGAEAIEKAGLNPSAILLDVGLPDLSGFEVCRRIKADSRTAQIPIVFLTASHQDLMSRDLGVASGGMAYLFHPVDPATLVSMVSVALLSRHADGRRTDTDGTAAAA